MWKLRPGWSANVLEGALIVNCDSKRFRVSSDLVSAEDLLQALHVGCAGADCEELAKGVSGRLIAALFERGAVMRVDELDDAGSSGMSSRQAEYFEHIGVRPDDAFRRMVESKVLVLGLGGTGSITLQHLVAAGIKRFVLVDDDVVESSNLERQFIYSKNDVGLQKAHAAAAYVLSRNPAADVDIQCRRIGCEEHLASIIDKIGDITFALICIDRPAGRAFDIATKVLWEKSIPSIHGGVMIRSGFYGPLFDKTKSLSAPWLFSLRRDQVAAPIAPLNIAFAPCNTIIAAAMAGEALHYLTGAFDLVDFQHRTFLDLAGRKFFKLGPLSELKLSE